MEDAPLNAGPGANTEAALDWADQASVWIPWYFTRGVMTVITAPLFLMFVFFTVSSTFEATIQGMALLRVMRAVFSRRVFVTLGTLFGFLGVVIVFLPPILYYSLAKKLPGLWLRPDASRRDRIFTSLLVLVLLPLLAFLIQRVIVVGIAWIADQNPCAAFTAGVTGSKIPVNCP
jgi:hypothetical protein